MSQYRILEKGSASPVATVAVTSPRSMGSTIEDDGSSYVVGPFRVESITLRDYFPVDNQLPSKFNALTASWKQDTAKLSLVQKKAMNLSYQRIIGMGKDALPFIFNELEKERDDWLWALEAITGRDDIVSPESNFDEAVDQWLKWGKANRYLIP